MTYQHKVDVKSFKLLLRLFEEENSLTLGYGHQRLEVLLNH